MLGTLNPRFQSNKNWDFSSITKLCSKIIQSLVSLYLLYLFYYLYFPFHKWAVTCDFQQCCNLTSVYSDMPVKPPVMLRNSKWCSVSSLTFVEYSSDKQGLWSDCAYAQADLRLCWSHIPHCWKSHVAAQVLKWKPICNPPMKWANKKKNWLK